MLNPIYREGLLIPGHNLWLDPERKKPFAVISHAHADHVARHNSFLATLQTIDLIRVRVGDALARRGIALPYGERYEKRDCCIRFYSAGHVLGSAMVHVETDSGKTLLYTGDFKMRPGVSSEPIEIPKADVVVMETTFGRPSYSFPSAEEVHAQLYDFCDKALESGLTPVLMAYSLGKAQEVLKILERYEGQLMAERVIRDVNQVYAHHGHSMPDTRQIDFLNMQGCVIVMPPTMRKQLPSRGIRSAMVTGWGLDDSARYRYGVDEIIPLSDHADYPDLINFVDQVSPKVIYTMHGYDKDFAADLRRRGHEAWTLSGSDQLELL